MHKQIKHIKLSFLSIKKSALLAFIFFLIQHSASALISANSGGQINFFYTPNHLPTGTNVVIGSQDTLFTAEKIVNHLTQGSSTVRTTIVPYTWPDIQQHVISTRIAESILEPVQPISFILNGDYEEKIADLQSKEISNKLTCEHFHNEVCTSITLE